MLKKFLLLLITVLLTVSFVACSPNTAASEGKNSSQASEKNTESSNTTPKQTNWELDISDDQVVKIGDYDVKVFFKMYGFKPGGDGILGTYYGGRASISYEMNLEKGDIRGNARGGGEDANLKVELVKYDGDAYYNFKPKSSDTLKELLFLKEKGWTKLDSMAMGQMVLQGKGDVTESVPQQDWNKSESKAKTIPYRMLVNKGEVYIFLYDLFAGKYLTFHGEVGKYNSGK